MSARILLVDDDRLVLATLSEGLKSHGYEVVTASSGEQALAIVEQAVPDLVILDIRMPGMSGIETARHLRKRGPIAFIFLSAYGSDDIVRLVTDERALGYLVKPIDIPHMIPTIEAALVRSTELNVLRATESHFI